MSRKHGRLIDSFRAAIAGIVATIAAERNMRIHLFIFSLVLAVEVIVRPSLPKVMAVLLVSTVVLGLELVNTAVESIVDLVTRGERHPVAKLAKDAAAGAVLVAALTAVAVGLYVFLPLWPFHWQLWTAVHWLGAAVNALILVAVVLALLRTRSR